MNRAKKETRDLLNHIRGSYYFRVKGMTPLPLLLRVLGVKPSSDYSIFLQSSRSSRIKEYLEKESLRGRKVSEADRETKVRIPKGKKNQSGNTGVY